MSILKAALPEKEIITHVKKLDGKTPGGDLQDKWSKYKSEQLALDKFELSNQEKLPKFTPLKSAPVKSV